MPRIRQAEPKTTTILRQGLPLFLRRGRGPYINVGMYLALARSQRAVHTARHPSERCFGLSSGTHAHVDMGSNRLKRVSAIVCVTPSTNPPSNCP